MCIGEILILNTVITIVQCYCQCMIYNSYIAKRVSGLEERLILTSSEVDSDLELSEQLVPVFKIDVIRFCG